MLGQAHFQATSYTNKEMNLSALSILDCMSSSFKFKKKNKLPLEAKQIFVTVYTYNIISVVYSVIMK